jgi:glycosyltransferase involved in cell wall biosynthesis
MILLDATKTAKAGHLSGLTRVNRRLEHALGSAARTIFWEDWAAPSTDKRDWFLTAELFCEQERPGIGALLALRPSRCAAIFHDAIPLKFPHSTWPQSVARHPGYMRLLASFDLVFAVSEASREELLGFWKWLGLAHTPHVEVLRLGADFDGSPRATRPPAQGERKALLCLGILEPRKNQELLLDACTGLWDQGLDFDLHIAGRVNPHFGRQTHQRILSLAKRYKGLQFHDSPRDAKLARIFASSRALLFPTRAEGCGLPLLESLWRGLPCVCSDLPVLMENAQGGGCLPVKAGDVTAWQEALRQILTDDALHAKLTQEALNRPLLTWADCAQHLTSVLT